MRFFLICLFFITIFLPNFELRAEGEAQSCPAIVERMVRQSSIQKDEFAPQRPIPFEKGDPGRVDFLNFINSSRRTVKISTRHFRLVGSQKLA
jgi:hypothetical protein